jgi:hypothetical protein
MRSWWLAYHLNILILISLIQQQEPAGSKARESWVRNRVREIEPLKMKVICTCQFKFHMIFLIILELFRTYHNSTVVFEGWHNTENSENRKHRAELECEVILYSSNYKYILNFMQ